MTELCVDASVAVKWAVKGEQHRSKARKLLHDAVARGLDLIAPPFFTAEVDTAIQRRVHQGRFTPAQAQAAFALLDAAPVLILNIPGVRQQARRIAEQFHQPTVYDATYLALAELRGCEFWTADEPLFKLVSPTLSFVRFLPNYP